MVKELRIRMGATLLGRFENKKLKTEGNKIIQKFQNSRQYVFVTTGGGIFKNSKW